MQFSKVFVYAFTLTLFGTTFADDESPDIEGTSKGVEFPFSDDAIIEVVELGADVAPIVLKDAVFFVNTTIVQSEYEEHTTELQKRDAEAWRWNKYFVGQPFYKREAEADASAEAWRWNKYFVGQPFYKREAEVDASAEAWRWNKYFVGQPFYKREAEADASAEAWRWNKYFVGQPFYKREAEADASAEAWRWNKYFVGQPFY